MAKTTVVIPNWNGMAYLKNCMDSLEKQDDRDFETLVIDNASKDGSVAFLRENYPWARVEVMPENLGFAGGVNEGIRRTKPLTCCFSTMTWKWSLILSKR